jgi:hypothetical protein
MINVKFYREVFQCHWPIDRVSRLEDAPFAIVEEPNCANEYFALVMYFVVFNDDGFRRRAFIDEVILPFPGVFVVAD